MEPNDPVAGHVPGARNAPTTETSAPTAGTCHRRSSSRHEALGVRDGVEVGAYCGSGVSAVQEMVAMEVAGYHAVLYPGSWSGGVATPPGRSPPASSYLRGPMSSVASAAARTLASPGSVAFSRFFA